VSNLPLPFPFLAETGSGDMLTLEKPVQTLGLMTEKSMSRSGEEERELFVMEEEAEAAVASKAAEVRAIVARSTGGKVKEQQKE
jgi:hypothetical protein